MGGCSYGRGGEGREGRGGRGGEGREGRGGEETCNSPVRTGQVLPYKGKEMGIYVHVTCYSPGLCDRDVEGPRPVS